MAQHILVITDQDNIYTLALEKANTIARQFNATVLVVSFVDNQQIDIDLDSYSATLSQHILHCFDPGLTVASRIVLTEDLVGWTENYCEKHPIDCVIKTGHRSENLFHTPTDWQLIRQLPCSVMIISEQAWPHHATLLAAVDAADLSPEQRKIDQQLLKQGYLWAKTQGRQLHAIYVAPISIDPLALGLTDGPDTTTQDQARAEQQLDQLITSVDVEGIEQHVAFGAVELCVPTLAHKLKADLVIVGSVGRSGIQGLLIGNTAEKILHNLSTDILVIKP